MASGFDFELQKKKIVKSIPHDLLTPINAITGFSQIMLDDALVADNAPLKEMVERINVNGNQLFDLIKKYLLFVEFEMNQVESDVRLTVISDDIIGAIADNAAKPYNRRNDIIIAENSALVEADYKLIEFALFELIDNALKHSEPGENITVDINKNSEQLELRISDNGCGFPIKEVQTLTPHFIIENCCSSSKNHGLSLLLIKKILELHNGELTTEPNKPKGAIVKLMLPLKNL